MKIYKLLSIAFAVAFMASCESNTYQEVTSTTTNPVYNANIKPIIQNNCVSCHNATYGQTPYFDSYAAVMDETLNGDLVCRIDDQSCGSVMPTSGKMPQSLIEVIKLWKANGCPEN